MDRLVPFLSLGFRIIVGIIFCYSAITKLVSIDYFEITIVEITNLSFSISYFISRWIIGIEFILGLYLILGWKLKSKTIPLVLLLLSTFTFLMIYFTLNDINTENCGCFGDVLFITPKETIVKNISIVLVLIGVLKSTTIYEFKLEKYNSTTFWGLLLMFWLILFITHPIKKGMINTSNVSTPINLNPICEDSTGFSSAVDLKKGKWLLGFISLECKYCKTAVRKLVQFKTQNPNIPIHLVMIGEKQAVNEFVTKYKMQDISYSYVRDPETILKVIIVPQIPIFYCINDGLLIQRLTHKELNFEEINNWLNKNK